MLDTLSPVLHDAVLAGLGASGMALVAAILPFANKWLNEIKPDSKILAQILSMMDLLLTDRADFSIKGVDLLDVAIQAANKINETDSLTEDTVKNLANKAAEKWSLKVFQSKLRN